MTAAFFFSWFFSVTDKSARAKDENKAFDAQFVRAMTGMGAEGAAKH
jgi:cation/acetate symporter